MDEYLIPNASYLRLLKEYTSYGTLVVAFDFDNTVYDFHKKGGTYNQVIELLREMDSLGFHLICFTANEDTEFIEGYLACNNIPYHGLNENPPFFKGKSGKIYFNALLDDRAGLVQVYQELDLLVKTIKQK
jgi:hypothetical protein